MFFTFFLISNFILLFILIKFQKKYNFLLDNNTSSFHKTHKGNIPLTGGMLIIINILALYFLTEINLSIKLIIVILLFYIIGVFSDLYSNFQPVIRLMLQFSLILIFIFSESFFLSETNIAIIDNILENRTLNSLFLSFCVIVLINGFNLLDGKNGLVVLNLIIIVIVLHLINQKNFNNDLIYIFLVIVLLIFFIFNITGNCFLGDSGVYVYGFLISYLAVDTYNNSILLSSMFIVNLLWLPCFENLFSIIRRYLLKNELTSPDKRHLHHLIHKFLVKKYNLGKVLSNSLTGIIINSYYLLSIMIAYHYMWNRSINFLILFFNVLFYVLLYIRLINKIYKIKIF